MLNHFDTNEFTEWIDAAISLIGEIPELPMPLAIKVSLDSSRSLLRDIKAWKKTVQISNYDNTTHIATIENPCNASIYEIKNVFVNGKIYCEMPNAASVNQPNKNFYKSISNNSLQFSGEKSINKRHNTVELILIPSLESTGIPKVLLDEFHEGLKYKCIENVYKSPYPKLTNIQMAQYYKEQYEEMKREYLRKPYLTEKQLPIASYGGY